MLSKYFSFLIWHYINQSISDFFGDFQMQQSTNCGEATSQKKLCSWNVCWKWDWRRRLAVAVWSQTLARDRESSKQSVEWNSKLRFGISLVNFADWVSCPVLWYNSVKPREWGEGKSEGESLICVQTLVGFARKHWQNVCVTSSERDNRQSYKYTHSAVKFLVFHGKYKACPINKPRDTSMDFVRNTRK